MTPSFRDFREFFQIAKFEDERKSAYLLESSFKEFHKFPRFAVGIYCPSKFDEKTKIVLASG